uniref:Uncharacterized protein n=1 Tax=Rhodococcus ruber TaxID=1830 RepID=Q93EX0_9NOCA|nr:unknown [Rhodococcus ruber]
MAAPSLVGWPDIDVEMAIPVSRPWESSPSEPMILPTGLPRTVPPRTATTRIMHNCATALEVWPRRKYQATGTEPTATAAPTIAGVEIVWVRLLEIATIEVENRFNQLKDMAQHTNQTPKDTTMSQIPNSDCRIEDSGRLVGCQSDPWSVENM